MMVHTAKTLEEDYNSLRSLALSLRSTLESAYNAAASGRSGRLIIDDYLTIGSIRDQIVDYASIAGLAAYGDSVEGGGYDTQAEYAALVSAINSVLSWIESNFPSSNGYVLAATLTGGTVVWRSFTGSQLSGYRSALQSVIDLIQAQ